LNVIISWIFAVLNTDSDVFSFALGYNVKNICLSAQISLDIWWR